MYNNICNYHFKDILTAEMKNVFYEKELIK